MSAPKRYLLRDAAGYFFRSTCGDGIEAHFTADQHAAYRFKKDELANFRRDYSHIKGRTVLYREPSKGQP